MPSQCCEQCFSDAVLTAQLQATYTSSGQLPPKEICSFCGSSDVEVYSLGIVGDTLRDALGPIIDLYSVAGAGRGGRSLAASLKKDWEFVSDKMDDAAMQRLLDALYGDSDSHRKLVKPNVIHQAVTLQINDDVRALSVGTWSDFSEEIKHLNRYHVKTLAIDSLKILLAQSIVDCTKAHLVRARISYDGCGFGPDGMKAPPQERASAGRINPAGISELYLADTKETACMEVRAGAFDVVSFGHFAANEDYLVQRQKQHIQVVDLSQLERLSPFDIEGIDDIDDANILKTYAANHQLLHDLPREFAKPMRSSDSPVEYVPTQYVAEYIKSVCKELDVDGVKYDSTLFAGGANYCFFDSEVFKCGDDVETERITSLTYNREPYGTVS